MNPDIRDCHPLLNCFYACPRKECPIGWHKYDLTAGKPLEEEGESDGTDL